MTTKNTAKTWAERCAESNGNMIMVPADMSEQSEDFQKKTEEYLAKAREFDKLSADFDVYAKNFWHSMRKSLEASGIEEIWGKNIGWNEQAKKEGIKVINIVAANGPMQMR